MEKYWVYIICNKPHGTLYVGVTNNISRRLYEHKEKLFEGFSKKYGLNKLVYAQKFENINQAIEFEKRLKKWKRIWKINLIEENNQNWQELSVI
jgi:putative endonuclease